jgi:hypothetical protein
MKALNDYPEWQKAESKLAELQSELREVEAGIDAHNAAMAGPQHRDRMGEAALAYLDGGPEPAPAVMHAETMAELRERRALLIKALTIHRQRMADMRHRLSGEICKEARPAYQKLIADLAKKAQALAEVAAQEERFRDGLLQGGVDFAALLPACPLRALGKASDDYSRLNIF